MRGILEAIRAHFDRHHCYVCGQKLPDGDRSGLCSSPECDLEDISRAAY